MDPRYAAEYRLLYEGHWWWRARERLILGALQRLAPSGGYGRILDVGCGDGLLLPQLNRFGQPEGIEPDATLVTEAGLASGTITIGPFGPNFRPEARYGLILMLDVLEHLEDDLAALRLANDLLAPGGVVLITVPAFEQLWTAHDDFNHHRRRYTAGQLRRAAAGAGLTPRELRYFFHWLFPLKLLVRLAERLWPRPPEVAQIPKPFWNRLGYAVSRLEQTTWGRFGLGFGSSLLAVCEPAAGKPCPSAARIGS